MTDNEKLLNFLQDSNLKKAFKATQNVIAGINKTSHFNIFTSVSDVYWRENLHSQLLKNILDPRTPELCDGDTKDIDLFLKILDLDSEFENKKSIFVETEVTDDKLSQLLQEHPNKSRKPGSENEDKIPGRIDILISDGAKCIIIENKINGAPNMPKQLIRYSKLVNKYHLILLKIVYLPLTHRKDIPEVDKKDNLVEITAVADKNCSLSLCENYLNPLKKRIITSNYTKRAYIEQYEKLITILGEKEQMDNVQKSIVKELCGTDEKQKNLNILMDLFSNKSKNFYQHKSDYIKEILCNKNGFENIIEGYSIIEKKIDQKKFPDFDVYFYTDGLWQIGIAIRDTDDKIKKQKRDKLKKSVQEKLKSKDKIVGWQQSYESGFSWIYSDLSEDFRNQSIQQTIVDLKDFESLIAKAIK